MPPAPELKLSSEIPLGEVPLGSGASGLVPPGEQAGTMQTLPSQNSSSPLPVTPSTKKRQRNSEPELLPTQSSDGSNTDTSLLIPELVSPYTFGFSQTRRNESVAEQDQLPSQAAAKAALRPLPRLAPKKQAQFAKPTEITMHKRGGRPETKEPVVSLVSALLPLPERMNVNPQPKVVHLSESLQSQNDFRIIRVVPSSPIRNKREGTAELVVVPQRVDERELEELVPLPNTKKKSAAHLKLVSKTQAAAKKNAPCEEDPGKSLHLRVASHVIAVETSTVNDAYFKPISYNKAAAPTFVR